MLLIMILIIIIKMEFGFASDRTNNAYFDRVVQMGVETSISEITYCLEVCKIAQRAHIDPKINFQQKDCLSNLLAIIDNCAKRISVNPLGDEE
jgi:hypothetical protein